MGFSQQDFDNSQKRKYQKWKDNQQTADKQAFDDYVRTFLGSQAGSSMDKTTQTIIDFNDPNELFRVKGNGYYKVSITTKNRPSNSENGYGIARILVENQNGTGSVEYSCCSGKSSGKVFYQSYETNIKSGWTELGSIDYRNKSNPKATTYTKEQIDDMIQHAQPIPPTPAGASSFVKIPQNNQTSSTIYGQYGVNLFDYRQLSRNPILNVGGKDGKTFTTKGAYEYQSNTKYWIGGSLGLAGIKENRTLTIDTTWWYPISNDSKTNFRIQWNYYSGGAGDSTITAGSTGSTVHKTTSFGSYSLILGSSQKGQPTKASVSVQPFYGEIKPKGLGRKFEFLNHRGYELKSNYDSTKEQSGGWRLRDEYINGTMYDEVVYKLGKVRLKDCNIYRPAVDLSHVHPDITKDLFLCVELPADCDDSGLKSQTSDQTMPDKCLTNNLPENLSLLNEQPLAEKDDMPYFSHEAVKIQVLVRQQDGTFKKELKKCWVIIASPKNAYKHQDLLSKTEIIYPLKTEKRVRVPNSGYVVTLTNGDMIESWKYDQVQDLTAEGCYKFHDGVGHSEVVVAKHQILSVTPHPNTRTFYQELNTPQFLPFDGESEETQIQTIPEKEE